MSSLFRRVAFTALLTTAIALDGIVVPSNIEAGKEVGVTFQNANDDHYRVYLAAALAGSDGPTCYLINSTILSSSINVLIPADVGPSADYYSIAISDLTTNQGATYSNRFNLSSATGEYSDYEGHLGGSPFWSASDLPCTAYPCARQCAQASYPADLTDNDAYGTMKSCILRCDGVGLAASQTAPARASTTSSATVLTGNMAIITAGSSTLTAIETERVYDGKTIIEAVVGDVQITLGGAPRTVNGQKVSLATDAVVVGGTETVKFASTTATWGGGAVPTAVDAVANTTSDGAGMSKRGWHFAGAAAGLAFVFVIG